MMTKFGLVLLALLLCDDSVVSREVQVDPLRDEGPSVSQSFFPTALEDPLFYAKAMNQMRQNFAIFGVLRISTEECSEAFDTLEDKSAVDDVIQNKCRQLVSNMGDSTEDNLNRIRDNCERTLWVEECVRRMNRDSTSCGLLDWSQLCTARRLLPWDNRPQILDFSVLVRNSQCIDDDGRMSAEFTETFSECSKLHLLNSGNLERCPKELLEKSFSKSRRSKRWALGPIPERDDPLNPCISGVFDSVEAMQAIYRQVMHCTLDTIRTDGDTILDHLDLSEFPRGVQRMIEDLFRDCTDNDCIITAMKNACLIKNIKDHQTPNQGY